MTFGGFVAGVKHLAGRAVENQGSVLIRIGGASGQGDDLVGAGRRGFGAVTSDGVRGGGQEQASRQGRNSKKE